MERIDESILEYREAARLNPDFEDAQINLEKAVNRLKPLAQEYLYKAEVSFHSLQNLEGALRECEKALNYEPESPEAHNLHGLILSDLGRVDEAIKAYQEAIRLKPDFEDALANLEDAQAESRNPGPKIGVGFAQRAGARLIDLLIHNLLWLLSGIASGFLIGIYSTMAGIPISTLSAKLQTSTSINVTLALIGYIMYHVLCEGLYGATLGKRLFNIHVLNIDGSPVSLGQAFIRSLTFYIDQLLFGMVAAINMGSSRLKQRLGDKWAHTIVIQRSSLPQFEQPSWQKFFIIFLLAAAADGLIGIVSHIVNIF
jgi:uncharacterized RDD family membrane protein YckC